MTDQVHPSLKDLLEATKQRNPAVDDFIAGFKPDAEKLHKMTMLLVTESDRGCILVAAAVIDRTLSDLVRSAMIDDSKATDELLGRGRPLESFGARIQLARCMGLLPDPFAADLDIIRRIRNHAAHHAEDVSFKDQKVIDLTNNLALVSVMPSSNLSSGSLAAMNSTRVRFIMESGFMQYTLEALLAIVGKAGRPLAGAALKQFLLGQEQKAGAK